MTYAPWMGRKIGVEMEISRVTRSGQSSTTHGAAAAVTAAFRAAGLDSSTVRDVGGWGSSSAGNNWDCKLDGSCGVEIASRAITLDAQGENAELRAACSALTAYGKVNSDCGLHVHIDVSDFSREDFQRLLALWYRYEPFFFGMVAKSRATSTYCVPKRSSEWNRNTASAWNEQAARRALTATSDAEMQRALTDLRHWGVKYSSMNISPYPLGGRVEFRLHHGTTNYEKIRRWAMWLLALVGRAKATHVPQVKRQVPKPIPNDCTLGNGLNPSRIAVGLGLFTRGAGERAPEYHAEQELVLAMMDWANDRRLAFRREGRAAGRLQAQRAGAF